MYNTDKDPVPGTLEGLAETEDNSQDSTLQWLLDMDMSEPEERLFSLEREEYTDSGLTDYELEVASRPMTRGRTDADDLATYVQEEIVISSEDQGSDIYAAKSLSDAEHTQSPASSSESMAIDYSRKRADEPVTANGAKAEGADILGLSEDDDMGEKFLVIKRVKHNGSAKPVSKNGATDSGQVVPESAGSKEPGNIDQAEVVTPEQDQVAAETVTEAPLMLDEAPVLRLVSTPGTAAVANEDTAAEVEQEQQQETAAAAESDVFDYVASVPPPAEDDAFDDYLLSGEQLQEGSPDFDQLAIEVGEGSGPIDLDKPIDYHPDFSTMNGFGGESVAAITPLIPQLMDEIFAAVQERLAVLGQARDSVRAEIMLGGAEAQVEQLMADGFEPAVAICGRPPVALQQLRQAEVDMIFLRLAHKDSGQSWNELFAEDFVVPSGTVESEDPAALREAPAQDEPVALSVFGDDLLSADPIDDFADDQWEPVEADIDAIFDDFEQTVEAVDGPDLVSELCENPVVEAVEPMQVFEDNIFSEDITGELEVSSEAPAEDIDALFDSLGQTLVDGDEICGLDVDEFSVTQATPALEEPAVLPSEEPTVAEQDSPVSVEQFSCIPDGIAFARASGSGTDIFADFLDAFIEEGSSEMEKLEDAIGVWEKDVAAESAYAVVARILHTIKGIAKGVGLQCYGTLIHNFETLLEALPRPEVGAEADYFRVVNAWLDAAVRGIDHIQNNRADVASEFPQLNNGAESTAGGTDVAVAIDSAVQEPVAAVPQGVVEQDRNLSKKMADEGARVLAAQQSVRITSDKLDHLLNLTNQAQQLGVRTAQSSVRGKRASAEMQSRLSSVRAHIASIADRALRSVTASGGQSTTAMDALEMDQYTELQEAANILREGVEDLADLVEFASRQNVQIEALLKQQTTVISNIGSSIRAARVVPVSRLIPGLRRLIRTVSVDLSKDVSFKVLNELGTLDRDDYARCQTILEHMARNALDHGIESAQERIAAGKPAAGTVSIDIRKAGADAVITLSDDGKGIDPEAMRDSACRKGLDVDVDALSDDEAVRLIFHKGFSTASTVSQISGRGVGMDIVLSELQEMGGDIQIESTVGKGTSFHIRIPSSITVNGALLVSAGDNSYAIPLGGLIAVEQVAVDEFFAAVENKTMLSVSGMDCEPAYLATLCRTGHALDAKTWRGTIPVLVAGSAERYMAIAVDDVEEALELVIRSLGVQFSTVPGVAGAATTADGLAVVALDLNLLVASVGVDDHASADVGRGRDESLLVMVVDDSRTQRMVATSQLETLGVETITAENGGVAIDLLNTADRLPDIILLDVEMPVKDGIQTLREIRKSVRYSHVPVIMVTSRTGLKHRALAQDAGCNGYMGKPFNFRMLVGQINELTGHRLQLS